MNPKPPSKLLPAWLFVIGTAVGVGSTWVVAINAGSEKPVARTPNLSRTQLTATIDAVLNPDGDFTLRADTLRPLLLVLPADDYPRLMSGLTTTRTPAGNWLQEQAMDIWLERDPALAAEWIGRHTETKQLEHYSAIALPLVFARDEPRALELLTTLPPAARSLALHHIIKSQSSQHPEDTVRRFGPDAWAENASAELIMPALAVWAKTDPPALVRWLIQQPDPNPRKFSYWLGDPKAYDPETWERLFNAVSTAPDLRYRQETLAQLLSNRFRADPRRALELLDQLPDSHLRHEVLSRIAGRYEPEQPALNLPLALALPPGADRNHKLRSLLNAWALQTPDAALDWLNTQDDPGVTAVAGVVRTATLVHLAQNDLNGALAAWTKIEDPQLRKAAIQPIAEVWSQTDPGAAVRWMHANQPEVISYSHWLVTEWLRQDPESALHWVEERVLADRVTPVMGCFGPGIQPLLAFWPTQFNHAETAQLLTKISDPALRAEALSAHLRDWLKHNRKTATAWLETNDSLTPEQAAALLAEADQ